MKSFYKIAILFFTLLTLVNCNKEVEPEVEPSKTVNYEDHHLQEVGASANELLSDSFFEKLTVNVVYIKGSKLSDDAINNVKSFLKKRLNKPVGIEFTMSEIEPPGLAPYSLDDIKKVEEDHRSSFTSDTKLTTFLFVADGNYADNNNVLGIAYRNTSMVIFHSRIDDATGGLGQPSTELVETTVLNHEFGHIMGLVNIGTDMQNDHQDQTNGNHCDVDNCLMYWSVETGDFLSNLVGESSPPDLDSQCIADLQANGGK